MYCDGAGFIETSTRKQWNMKRRIKDFLKNLFKNIVK